MENAELADAARAVAMPLPSELPPSPRDGVTGMCKVG